jgi:hypothetical protein
LPPVFILDQAEEMFTDPLTGEQDALINEIGHLLQQNENATVVMGFRSDYYNQMNRVAVGREGETRRTRPETATIRRLSGR